jgi:hypothetical protein
VEHYSINTQFLLASIVDPWSINQVINAILSLTDDYQQINLVICGVDFNNEDLELKDDEVIVRVTEHRMKFITDEFDRLGRKYRLVEA